MKIRCFTALCFSPDTLEAIAGYIGDLKHVIPDEAATIKWEKKENLHLTLNFFGEIEERILQNIIKETKKNISVGMAISLSLSGIGTFPDKKNPKIIWLGCEEQSGRLEKTHAIINAIARDFGEGQVNIESRRFISHVTMGRVKLLNKPFLVSSTLEKYAQNHAFSVNQDINCLSFMRSVLTSGGSLYTIMENIPL